MKDLGSDDEGEEEPTDRVNIAESLIKMYRSRGIKWVKEALAEVEKEK